MRAVETHTGLGMKNSNKNSDFKGSALPCTLLPLMGFHSFQCVARSSCTKPHSHLQLRDSLGVQCSLPSLG